MAEGVGFEPTDPAKGQRFSRPPLSTTQPSLQDDKCHYSKPEQNEKGPRQNICIFYWFGGFYGPLSGYFILLFHWQFVRLVVGLFLWQVFAYRADSHIGATYV